MIIKKLHYILLLLLMLVSSCRNKELSLVDPCDPDEGNWTVKVQMNWENPLQEARAMRINIFSQMDGVVDYGRDVVPVSGEKYIMLVKNAAYRPLCYDYNSKVSFRNETTLQQFQAYMPEAYRATYNNLATPVPGESTVTDPGGDLYVHSWLEDFDVIPNNDESVLVINYYPKNILRTFTYRINNVKGASYVSEGRGAISGMAATYHFHTDQLATVRSTVLFEDSKTGTTSGGVEYIEGSFTTFGPVHPYQNRFTIELLAGSSYYTAYWDVSDQIDETMTDREAKLARDGYDILIDNNDAIPEIPDPGGGGGGDSGSGFEIGVEEWDNVDIYL